MRRRDSLSVWEFKQARGTTDFQSPHTHCYAFIPDCHCLHCSWHRTRTQTLIQHLTEHFLTKTSRFCVSLFLPGVLSSSKQSKVTLDRWIFPPAPCRAIAWIWVQHPTGRGRNRTGKSPFSSNSSDQLWIIEHFFRKQISNLWFKHKALPPAKIQLILILDENRNEAKVKSLNQGTEIVPGESGVQLQSSNDKSWILKLKFTVRSSQPVLTQNTRSPVFELQMDFENPCLIKQEKKKKKKDKWKDHFASNHFLKMS